jgi:hypothetical protein
LDFADKICTEIKVVQDNIIKKLEDLAEGDDKSDAMINAMLHLKMYSTIAMQMRKISTKYAHL